MSDRAGQSDGSGAAFDAALARWSADSALSPLFRTPGGVALVLDAACERVLHASPSAQSLRAAIADADGCLRNVLRLPEQIRPAGFSTPGVRLIRIRFDARGVARPTTCLLARASITGEDTVLLLAPAEPLPALRAIAVRPRPIEPVPEPVPEHPPASSARIVWRSDADGVLTHVSGAPPDVAKALSGRSWHGLAETVFVAGESLLSAIDGRQTFRALALIVRTPDAEHDVEVSGAPSARPGQPFAGFSGFGLLRGRRPHAQTGAEAPVAAPDEPLDDKHSPAPATISPVLATDEAALAAASAEPVAAARSEESIPVEINPSEPEASSAPAAEPKEPAPEDGRAVEAHAPAEQHDSGELSHPESESSEARSADLSTQEHAAFREIARALGARFAGDEEAPGAAGPSLDMQRRGAVMAFPVSAAQQASAAIDAAIVSALDRLPAGVLVHRDASILYVNRHFLGLTGYPDREAMERTRGLDPLLRLETSEAGSGGSNAPVSIRSGNGTLTPLMTERSKVDWDGDTAELLLVRAASEADRTREQIAKGLFQAHDAGRERDTQILLDHIEEGVATLDETGRVLGLNRSAARLLSSQAREVVGGMLADLFAPDSEPSIAKSLSEARETGTSEPREAKPLTGADDGPLRLRIARFSSTDATRFCATLREPTKPEPARPEPRGIEPERARRADFLARIDHEIRSPLDGIVNHATALLAERPDPLGSERYRDELGRIQASGRHVLTVVEDLLDLARIEAGQGGLTFTDIALNDVVSGCIAQMQPQAARDRIVVRTSLAPDLKPLVADERSMRQATLNVIANAIRLTEAGGQVIVSTTTAERGEIAFRVRDTGIGMTPEEIENALEPFRPIDPAMRRDGSGLGGDLGLTLTKALVEANHGRLRITSRKNEGTLVEMLFLPPQALSA